MMRLVKLQKQNQQGIVPLGVCLPSFFFPSLPFIIIIEPKMCARHFPKRLRIYLKIK